MNKFKILVVLILCFAFYKGFVAIKNFEIGVGSRVDAIVSGGKIIEVIEELEVL